MEHKTQLRNAMVQHVSGNSALACADSQLRTQVAALEATIAYCQTHRQRHEEKARALEALCYELRLRATRPN